MAKLQVRDFVDLLSEEADSNFEFEVVPLDSDHQAVAPVHGTDIVIGIYGRQDHVALLFVTLPETPLMYVYGVYEDDTVDPNKLAETLS